MASFAEREAQEAITAMARDVRRIADALELANLLTADNNLTIEPSDKIRAVLTDLLFKQVRGL
jgi:hypothetical protein